MKQRLAPLLVVLLLPAVAEGARFAVTDRIAKNLPLESAGSVWVENEAGSIEIVGTDEPGIQVVATKTIRGVDEAALSEGRLQTQWVMSGDSRISYIRTMMPPVRSGRWASEVAYSLRVPKTAQVKIASHSSDIRIINVSGRITVKNVNGTISLERSTGPAIVESINGTIILDGRPSGDTQLTTVSGNVEVRVAGNTGFEWVADSISRDFRTTFPIRGRFVGNTFRGSIGRGGPTIRTATLLGSITLLKIGTKVAEARVVQAMPVDNRPLPPVAPPKKRVHQMPMVNGNYSYATAVGDVSIGEIRGNARIETGGGEVQLGTVRGDCQVISVGGPLELGEIGGTLVASTGAGDVFVRAALLGGMVNTAGGMVRIDHSAGPMMNITSLGGDIVVSRAAGPVMADTKSGDITITVDPLLKRGRIMAKTAKGNVLLNLPPGFAADIDATVLTTEVDNEMIRSDFKSLSITRDQVGGKTRIRATGKINGGGERIELIADGGRITIGRLPR